MPDLLGIWVAPLLLIPGMALLTISTGNRYGQLQLYLAQGPEMPGLTAQLRSLRWALSALYLGIGVDAAGALLGGLLAPPVARPVLIVFSCGGVALLVIAALTLTMDMWRSPTLKQQRKDT